MLRAMVRLAVALVLIALLLFLNMYSVRADGNVFGGVSDILGGRRLLFPEDDAIAGIQPPYGAVSTNIVQTQNSNWANQIGYNVNNGPDSFAVGVGRMFNLPRDVVVTLTTGTITIRDQDPNGAVQAAFPLNANAPVNQDQLAAADFTGDGYTDFAYIMQGSIYIVTAQDVKNINAGVFVGDAGIPAFSTQDWTTLAAGDFDGDGHPEIALASAQSNNTIAVQIFTVKPTFNSNNQIQGISFTRTGLGSLPVTAFASPVYITAGNFSGIYNPQTASPIDQIALLYEYQTGSGYTVELMSVNVTPHFDTNPPRHTLTQVATNQEILSQVPLDTLTLTSGYINFYGQTEQIVTGFHEAGYNAYIQFHAFDDQLNIDFLGLTKAFTASNQAMQRVALGNFDQPNGSSGPLTLQLAALVWDINSNYCNNNDGRALIYLFNIDPSNGYALTNSANTQVGSCFTPGIQPGMTLATGDTQGRSLFLGNPSRIVAQSIQPEVILDSPPMHVDYVTPVGSNAATPLNLSAVSSGFYSSYQTSVTNQNQSTRKSTTSFSTSLSETIDQKVVFGEPDVASVTVETKNSASQMWSNSVSQTFNNLNSYAFDASTNTGFGDQLWYISQRQNIYIYPVIGQYGCPASKPFCNPSEMAPRTIMYAGPDQVQPVSINGTSVEWYQPVQEPGNVFTYPWNLAQLQAQQPNINLLTSGTPTTFYTDSSTNTQQAQWANQNGQSTTSGSAANYAWSKSVSISGDVSADEFGVGGGTTFSFSYNGSKSFSTLASSTTSLGQSTGVGITKPGTFANPGEYQYAIAPYIFGSNPVTGTIQDLQPGTQVQTNGVLTSGFTADPTDPNAGAWWGSAYTLPDVALNHPNRWNIASQINLQPGPNCLRISSTSTTVNCATFNQPNNQNLWVSEFYWMKGFFITPIESNGDGPQIDSATAGDKILLQARVYNESLTDMPSNGSVVVQFYGQPFNPVTKQPIGNSFLINTVGIAPIPGFNSNSNGGTLPNWSMASTQWDTTNYSDQSIVFWVVVYIKDSNGQLAGEMPGHGLTGMPPTFQSIPATASYLQPYSNNIGLYKSLFYVAPPQTASAAPPESAARLQLSPLAISKPSAYLNRKVVVSTSVSAGARRKGLVVTFYRGNPDKNGKAFEFERISNVRGGDSDRVRVLYRPTRCGKQNLYARLYPNGATVQTQLNVTIKPIPPVRKMLKFLQHIFTPTTLNAEKRGDGMIARLQEAIKFFQDNNRGAALQSLGKFRDRVKNQSGKSLTTDQAAQFLAQTNQIFDCVKP